MQSVWAFDDENSQYQVEDIGHIKCLHPEHNFPAPLWCQHLADACRTGSDQAAIWKYPDWDLTELSVRELDIPIFPTMNLWTAVDLVPHEKFRRYKVMWTHGTATQDKPVLVLQISPGEGRQAIRMSMIEYMISKIDFHTTQCTSGSHGVLAQIKWEAAMREDKTAIPQFWSVFTSNMCIACQIAYSDFSDAVPDRESTIWNA
jgi:hypothetical protein